MKKILLPLVLCLALTSRSQVVCQGSGYPLYAGNPQNLSNPSYSLFPGASTSASGSFVVTPSVTTTYTLVTGGLNSNSVAATTSAVVTVTVLPQPSAAPTLTQSTCTSTVNVVNLNVTFSSANPNANYSIMWSPVPSGIFTSTQQTVSGLSPGTYNFTVTAAGGCSTSGSFVVNPQPASAAFMLTTSGNSYVIDCNNPSLQVMASSGTSNNYTWTSGVTAPQTGTSIVISGSGVGNWTVTGVNTISGCSRQNTFSISQNTTMPTSVLTPTFQNITCNLTSVTNVSVLGTPTVNVSHYFTSPFGGVLNIPTYSATYFPAGPGTYTHCAVNNVNGCSTCKTFTVVSTQGFPTFSLTSPQNFTLGCNSKSVATIAIINAATTPTPGGPVSYTLLPPGGSSITPAGSLSAISAYSMNNCGTWTVVVKDNTNACETRVAFSVLCNTFPPDISANVPTQILSCFTPSVELQGTSMTNNVSYNWLYPGTPGNSANQNYTVYANTAVPTSSMVANFTLTITDNSSTCKSTSVIPIYQNLYPPKAMINNGGNGSITCNTPTIVLTNQSSTGIPPGFFQTTLPVIGYLWEGPMPQTPLQLSTTYIAYVPGVYTLTAQDLNNGCKSVTTTIVSDGRIYPLINNPVGPPPFTLPCPGTVSLTPFITSPTVGLTYTWTVPNNATVTGMNSAILTTNMAGIYTITATDPSNGCAASATMAVYACVGLEEIGAQNLVRIYPNPGNGLFRVSAQNNSGKLAAKVYNTLGVMVAEKELTGEMEINLQNEASGIYVIMVTDGGRPIQTTRVIKR